MEQFSLNTKWKMVARGVAALSVTLLVAAIPAQAQEFSFFNQKFWPGNLVVSRSVYDNNPANIAVGTVLPPNCAGTQAGCPGTTGATNDGTYPYVFNNDRYDSNFGITAKIYLDQLTPWGWRINSVEVPNSSQGLDNSRDQLVSSFSSKSELGLQLSTDGRYLTFMGYVAPVNAIDVSNSNTPLAVDPTNPVGEAFYRAVAQVDAYGRFRFTETNAYSGNNGRSVILNNGDGDHDRDDANVYYVAGNAGNGGNPQPDNIILGAGAQLIEPLHVSEASQNPVVPTPLASFSIAALGDKADKIGKDDNFRGITIFNNVVYYTKGSGGNGVNTVYFVDTTGSACPNGVGVPAAGAKLPTQPLSYNPATLQTTGLPTNMCVLAGFPTVPAKKATTLSYPFALWFADANTLYVADEGDGYTGGQDLYTHAAAQTTAGLQKWVFDAAAQKWTLAYTLQSGLDLGTAYNVKNYPTGTNAATGLPWIPATDGLRQITGRVFGDGTVLIWGITSTVSGNGDVGADPNRLVVVADNLANTDSTQAAAERFVTLRTAKFGEVLRGVSFTPGTRLGHREW